MKSTSDLVIIGAGAAGIGAAYAARNEGLDYTVIEASHRVGGRGLTEELAPGIPWDLGCHWLHSGSINPLAHLADKLGIDYDKKLPTRGFYRNGQRLTADEEARYQQYTEKQWENMERAQANGRDVSLSDLMEESGDLDSEWAPYYTHWQALMTSHDVDRFSALDLVRYEDTDENWPVRQGYGTLLERLADGLSITLNTTVQQIDWSGKGVTVTTNRGSIHADRVIITVSTGVLGARDITFKPDLPLATREAIEALPVGCYNNFAMLYEEQWPFDSDTPERIDYTNGNDINFAFKLRCSDWPYIYCAVAGRQAEWLESQPAEASRDLMMTALVDTFGSDFKQKITKFRSSAWGNDPFVRGAYSASRPGYADQRKVLATPIADKMYFAGEAASERAFATAHGAWQTGVDSVALCKNI